MQPAASKPPNLPEARETRNRLFGFSRKESRPIPKPDAIAIARAKRADEDLRNPENERKAMLRFLAYLKPSSFYFIIASLCGVTIYLVPNSISIFFGYVIDHVAAPAANVPVKHNFLYNIVDAYLRHAAPPNASPVTKVNVLLGSLLAILPFWGVLVFIRSYFAGIGGQRVIFKLRNDLYSHIQSMSLSFFSSHRSGSIVSRLTSDVAQAQNFIGNACTNLWMDLLALLVLGTVLFRLDYRLALVAFSILPLWIVLVRFFGQGIRKGSLGVQEGLSELSGQVQEKVSGATVVQAFARERFEMRSFFRLHHALLHRQIGVVKLSALNMTAANLLTTMAPVTVLLVGAHEVLAGRLTVGTLVIFWAMLGTFYGPLQRITDLAAVIANSSAAIERIFQIFDIQSDIQDVPDAVVLSDRIEGRVELRNVSFGYDENTILKDVNLTVRPGEVVAFVGPSGAGKSTLVNLIPRFYDVTAGEILVDDVNIAHVAIKSLRNSVGMVLQENILFTGSVRDNILYGRPNATEDEIIEAAVAANAHEFISELPEGYDTEIGERGTKLSGGQKQRLAITRAFLRDPRILILDEATSALDSESERLIQNALNRLMVGRTTLIIAHRLSTIMHADTIVAMKDGRIAETGKHNDLLANRGIYYHLYKAQFEHAINMHTTFIDSDTADTPAAEPAKANQATERLAWSSC